MLGGYTPTNPAQLRCNRKSHNLNRDSVTHLHLRRYRLADNEKIKRIMEYLNFIKQFRWVSPRESKADPDCAIMEFDIEFKPETVKWLSLIIAVLRLWDPHIDTDHPVFTYLAKQKKTKQVSHLTLTVSIRPRGEV